MILQQSAGPGFAPPVHPSRLEKVAAVAMLLLACGALVRAHLFYMTPPVWLNIDEGNASAIAIRLLDGKHLPYVDGISIRGPLMYWIYELALWIGGTFSLEAIRVGGLLSSLGIALSVWSVPFVLGSPIAGGFAALCVVLSISVGWMPNEGLAWNAESIGLPAAIGSLTCGILAMRRASTTKGFSLLFLCGALGTAAFFVKQPFGPHLVWTTICIVVLAPAAQTKVRLRRLVAIVVGSATVAVAVLLPYAVMGHLGEFWYYFVEYGSKVHLEPVTPADILHSFRIQILERFTFSVPVLVGILLLLLQMRRWSERRWGSGLVLGHAIAAIPLSVLTGRTFGHYFLQTDAFASILLAISLFGLAQQFLRGRPRIGISMTAGIGIALLVLILVGQSRVWRTLNSGSWAEWFNATMVPAKEPISTWILQNTQEEDRIFVWGFRGDVYLNSRRKPASRFVFSVFLSGVVPWYKEPLATQQGRIVPGSHDLLLRELREARPRIIVDGGFSMLYRYMVQYPDLREYLEANYTLAHIASIFGGHFPEEKIPLYLRMDSPAPGRQ